MIYMTTDEWNKIATLIIAQDFDKLVSELAIRTWDLNISQEELEAKVADVKQINKKENSAAKEDEEDKRLWRVKSICVYKRLPIPCEERYSDVRELTVDEAVSWYKDCIKHLNDYSCDGFTVFDRGLFYKKDDEWIRYE